MTIRERDANFSLPELERRACSTVTVAGGVLLDYFYQGVEVWEKGTLDITTEADKKVDHFLRQKLAEVFPDALFLTEETPNTDLSVFQRCKDLIVIDSLDGTNNFSRKNPDFGISVARLIEGVPVLGIVYLPISNELLLARDSSDTAYLNGRQIHVSSRDALRSATLNCDWVYNSENRRTVLEWLGRLVDPIGTIKSMGSAVKDLCRLAKGEIDVFLNSGLKPWDTAAAAFIVQKAGGKVTTADGRSWNLFEPDILATNSILHPSLLKIINC